MTTRTPTPERLRRRIREEILFSAATYSGVAEGDVDRAAAEMTQSVGTLLGIDRVSVWLFNEEGTELGCVDLYERKTGRHFSGIALSARQCRYEFEALNSARYLGADDALIDRRTAGCVEEYLKPLGIASLLDGVIRAGKKNIGLVSLERLEKVHHWKQDEASFVCQLADQMSMAVMNRERQKAEEALRESEERARRAAEVNRTMAEIGQIISSSLSIDEVYEQFAAVVKGIIQFDRLTIGIIDAERGACSLQHTTGLALSGRMKGDCLPLTSIVAEVVRRRSGVLLHAGDQGFTKEYPSLEALFKIGIRSIMDAPLFSRDEVVGTLLFGSVKPQSYTDGDLTLAVEVARQISGALANAQHFTERKRAEEDLIKHRDMLEDLVRERTGELEEKSRNLEELNVTLKVLLRQVQEDREKLEHRLVSNLSRLVLPYLEKIKKGGLDDRMRSYVGIVEGNLREIMSPFLHKVQQLSLTPRESQVASLVRDGKTTKEIGEIMGIAPSAVSTLRNRMRSKLHLNKKKINLRSYLQSLG